MNKEFVKYEQALVLKELGFNESCFGYYIETKEWIPASYSQKGTIYPSNLDLMKEWVSAPLYQQAFRWFREKHNLIAYPVWGIDNTWDMNIQKLDSYGLLSGQSTLAIIKKPTYEEAEPACLDKLIEIVRLTKP